MTPSTRPAPHVPRERRRGTGDAPRLVAEASLGLASAVFLASTMNDGFGARDARDGYVFDVQFNIHCTPNLSVSLP
jgi:hypothetical protein